MFLGEGLGRLVVFGGMERGILSIKRVGGRTKATPMSFGLIMSAIFGIDIELLTSL